MRRLRLTHFFVEDGFSSCPLLGFPFKQGGKKALHR